MALGKAAKQRRNLIPIIHSKIEAKMRTKEYLEKFHTILDRFERKYGKEHEFRMSVYSHFLLDGQKMTASQWRDYIKIYEE
jgi:hypothetical protein